MKINKETIIVGGIPNPIGGVTTFLSRLIKAYSQYVIMLLDLYPSEDKRIPKNFSGHYKLAKNKIIAIFLVFLAQLKYRNKDFFFNFSSGNSLVFFIFLPKINNKWSLMLHHGHLTSRLPKFLLKFILNKFDTIYTLSDRQADFYKSINLHYSLVSENSYVPASFIDIDESEKLPLNIVKESKFKVVVGSGFPRPLYQHHLLIDLINRNQNAYLFLFLYGEGELKHQLLNLNHPRIKVFIDKEEDIFNYYLSKADLYIRPTLEDSFGIACADAIEFGVPVIASDVCRRYSGVQVYNTEEFLFLKSRNVLERE
ncbi:glycosyltransferase [Acinetobacter sp. WU_MDCI_Abxb74]|uniref:glycosyltransferase n=1 Tax=Acinetobacter sp. WU_MDCI_Abxb74 TaxID=2850072 RepID=UPI0021CD4D48|nr:glycosyltransferase [Acinetobacter sp. WU_MDCI_Abxb74]MCU4425354.1 glycosyltransferase [Acinetobacter sp. WU_MDCI_Abxb74]